MRVLIADKLPDYARVRLASDGCEVRVEVGASGDPLRALLREFDPDVLVVRSTKVQRQHIESSNRLSLIVRAGAGVDNVDLVAASERAIYVANCPGKNATAVAELTFGLLLAVDRHIAQACQSLKEQKWNKKAYSKSRGLKGRTLGLIGLGGIGKEVAKLGNAFGMEVLAWSRSLTEELATEAGVRRYGTPEDVARRSDVLSIHLARTPETIGFVGESIFDEMKSGSIFLNTARSEVVDEAALLSAMDSKGVRAGLDVFKGEPGVKEGPFDSIVARHPSVVGTHHIGASTEQAQEAVADEVCRIVALYSRDRRVPNGVNLATKTEADHSLIVRHADRVGVLAFVFDALQGAHINIQEMENIVFSDGEAATARIHVVGQPKPALIRQLDDHEHIFSVEVVILEGKNGSNS